jgi:hypothetical protein
MLSIGISEKFEVANNSADWLGAIDRPESFIPQAYGEYHAAIEELIGRDGTTGRIPTVAAEDGSILAWTNDIGTEHLVWLVPGSITCIKAHHDGSGSTVTLLSKNGTFTVSGSEMDAWGRKTEILTETTDLVALASLLAS